MAITYTNYTKSNITTTASGDIIKAFINDSILIGCIICNKGVSDIKVTVFLRQATSKYYLALNQPVLVGESIEIIDSKVSAKNGNELVAICDTGTSCDMLVSAIEDINYTGAA